MKPHRIVGLVLLASTTVAVPPALADDDDWCRQYGHSRTGWHCEVREITLPATGGQIAVDAGLNGGISVESWDRSEILVQARVAAHAESDDGAREIVSRVRLETDGTIQALGPEEGAEESWWVSFRLRTPSRTDLSLKARNGGLKVTDVVGTMDLATANGGISLSGLGGAVRARTGNGGLSVRLTGTGWEGHGLDAETTNGGVKLRVPEGYNARLETGTLNGRTQLGFPLTVSGDLKRISVDLGDGGAPVRVMTTNGGLTIERP